MCLLVFTSLLFAALSAHFTEAQPDSSTQGDLRLIINDEIGTVFGRVEIYIDGVWGTICDPGPDSVAPTVVCRQLGFDSVARSGSDLGFGFGDSRQQIWLDNVECPTVLSPTSNLLNDCTYNAFADHECNHLEVLMVSCLNSPDPVTGDIRRVSSSGRDLDSIDPESDETIRGGRIEIYIQGEYGTICLDPGRDQQALADVACRQLGFNEALRYGSDLRYGFAPDTTPIWLDNVGCVPTGDHIFTDCVYNPFGINDCSNSDALMVECRSAPRDNTGLILAVVLPILAFIFVCVIPITCVVCCVCHKKKKQSKTTAETTAAPVAAPTQQSATANIQMQPQAKAPAYPRQAPYPGQPTPAPPTTQQQQSAAYPPPQAYSQNPVPATGGVGYPPVQQAGYYPQQSAYPPQQAGQPPPQQIGYPAPQPAASAPPLASPYGSQQQAANLPPPPYSALPEQGSSAPPPPEKAPFPG